MAQKVESIELKPINVKTAEVFIVGDGDLVLNKMNARTVRTLTEERKGKKTVDETPNMWEDIITAINWRDPLNMDDTRNCTEDDLIRLLCDNAPCISAFGLKKSFGQAVTQNEIDRYSTKFNNAVNIVANGGLVPISFTEHSIDERLMSPKQGSPILVRLNHFSGWRASFKIGYTENVYSLEQIVNIINLAGFGLGIGSGRTSGYGRYHVEDVK